MAEYVIQEETLVGIADETIDLSGTTSELTTISTYYREE